MALRQGDGALVFSARSDSDALELTFDWLEGLELPFGDTQYVSGTSRARLPSDDMVLVT